MLNRQPAFATFARRIARWQRKAGRHGMPWQGTRDPYRIWLSEIMLQQTQVATAAGYYQRFLQRFPNVNTLADASMDDVMRHWAGLGYYARARNLHQGARTVMARWHGEFPRDAATIAQLPGIGRSTAAAIAAFAFGAREPILDGNVKRILTRHFGIEGDPGRSAVTRCLWTLAEQTLAAAPANLDITAYTQGLMDLGATVCTRRRPRCDACPLKSSCYARLAARQEDFPARTARAARPERNCQMLILRCEDCVFLQRRPAAGIWGGLWCPPQYDDRASLAAALDGWGATLSDARQLPPFRHDFTHFRLHVEPWLATIADHRLAEPISAPNWIAATELRATALPAPIKKLFAALFRDINPRAADSAEYS